MRSTLFQIPYLNVPIHGYGVMLVVALFSGLFLAQRLSRAQRVPVNPTQLMDMAVIAMICGVIGARLVYVLRNLESFRGAPLDIFKVWEGGLVFHGGLVGGTIGVIWHLRRQKIPVLKMGDVLMPCIFLGLAFGRIGCFLNGCCYGRVAPELPCAVTFPPKSLVYSSHLQDKLIEEGAARSLPVHPVQLYDSLAAVLAAAALVWLCGRKRFDGQILAIAAMAYGVIRFFIQFLRDDEERVLSGLTLSQILSVALLVAGGILYQAFRSRAGPSRLEQAA